MFKKIGLAMLNALVLLTSVMLPILPTQTAQATVTTYNHIIPFTITDTSGVARSNLPVIITYDTNGKLIAYGLTNATCTDTYMDSTGASNSPVGNGTAYSYAMASSNITAVIPSLPAFGSVTLNLYTGYAPVQTSFPIITGGTNGYVSTNDTAPLERGSNFQDVISGYIDTTAGSGKYLENKDNALRLYVSPTVSGNITADIYYSSTTRSQLQGDGWQYVYSTGAGGYARYGQRINSFPASSLTDITFLLIKVGSPTGTGYVKAYKASDGSVLGTLGSIDVSTIPLVQTTFTFSTPVSIPSIMDIRIAFEYSGGDGSNKIGVCIKGSDVAAGENACSYIAAWSDVAGTDTYYSLNYIPAGIAKTVTVTGISSGEHLITLQEDGVHLWLTVDAVASTNETAVAVPDNTNVTVWGQNNVMPYITYIKSTVSGVEKLWYQPQAKISSDLIPDRDSTMAGNVTWGTNASITVTGGNIMDSKSATSVGATSVMMQGNYFYVGTYSSVYLSFQYGLDTTYGYWTTESSATIAQAYSVTLTGLTPNTTYHYRAVARNGVVYSYGADIAVTTNYSSSSMGSTTPLIPTAAVFRSYSATNDWLFVAECIVTYPPYYPTKNPMDYFQLQLISTDGSTILGASPIKQWGDRPESISFSAATATLTYGSAYTIRIATISSDLSVTYMPTDYELQPSDWHGSNLNGLDDWCIGVAANMQNTDGTVITSPYLLSVTGYGVIITSNAGGYFTTGIPNIAQVRPNLFSSSQHDNTIPTLSGAVNYNPGATLNNRLGNNLVTDMGTIAAVFGMSAQQGFQLAVVGLVVMFVLFTMSRTAGFGALGALCLTTPIWGSAAYLSILDIVVIAVVGILFLFLAVRQLVIKTM